MVVNLKPFKAMSAVFLKVRKSRKYRLWIPSVYCLVKICDPQKSTKASTLFGYVAKNGTKEMGVNPKIGGFYLPKWMVYFMEKPIKMGWFGGTTIFLETSKWHQEFVWNLPLQLGGGYRLACRCVALCLSNLNGGRTGQQFCDGETRGEKGNALVGTQWPPLLLTKLFNLRLK